MGNLRVKEPGRPLPRGIVRYRVRMDYQGKTHSLGVFDTITDAKAALSIAKADAARGVFVPPAERRAAKRANDEKADAEAVTLREWSEVWLARLEANPERSRATVLSYRSVMKNHVWPELGEVRLRDLTTQQVADHLGLLASRPSNVTPEPGSMV